MQKSPRMKLKPSGENRSRNHRVLILSERNVYRLMLLLPLLLITACAAPLPKSSAACPQIPPKPIVIQPTPQPSYLERAAKNIEQWQKALIDTQSKPQP